MQRTRSRFCFTLALGFLSVSCSTDLPTSSTPASTPSISADRGGNGKDGDDQRGNPHDRVPVTYAVIGDVPYAPFATPTDRFPTLVGAINGDPAVSRVVHLGDIKAGSTVCSDEYFQSMATAFTAFADPLVYTIGDNEWTDCHRANNGGYNPLDRLAKVRQLFFPQPGVTLGQAVPITAQARYPENQRWMASEVVFSAFHILGSNNGLAPWFGDRASPVGETPAETAAREAEVAARQAVNLAWLEETFADARDGHARGVVLFLQADMWHPDDRAAGAEFSAHTSFVTRLAQLAEKFKRPVLLIAGDSHDYRVDAGVPWFSLYGVTPVSNITQIIVDRSIEATTDASPIDYLRLRVDPTSKAVFNWEQVILN